jgi:ubiquinone/menaquinone biosynthesis C-methylase UbiE
MKNQIHTGIFERMPNIAFRVMSVLMKIVDLIRPNYISDKIKYFDVRAGTTVVDYGCGPGRYIKKLSELVGNEGKVFAVDIQPLAISYVKKIKEKNNLTNVEMSLADGYNCGLEDGTADVVYCLDMFHGINNPSLLLGEIKRITKNNGVLVIDDGHQSRAEAKRKIEESGFWDIVFESKSHLKCKLK